MKLKLNKKKLKNLSKDNKALPMDMTPEVAGAAVITSRCTLWCHSNNCNGTGLATNPHCPPQEDSQDFCETLGC